MAITLCMAHAQTVLNVRTIFLAAALDQCRKNGFVVTVTLLDRLGRTQVMLHDDDANPHTVETACARRIQASLPRVPSGEYNRRLTANPKLVGLLSLANMTLIEGGLPIMASKELGGDWHFRRSRRPPGRGVRASLLRLHRKKPRRKLSAAPVRWRQVG